VAKNLSRQAQSLIKSIFLGQGEFLPSKTRDLFERWGISHFLARSGIHLIVFAAVLLWLLQYCLVPVRFSRAASAFVVILYYGISSPSISFLRAFSMNMLLAVAIFFGESAQLLHLFSLITLAALYTNPFWAYGLDFQLSFGISGALIFIFTLMHTLDTQSNTNRRKKVKNESDKPL
jgi:competence protein ComEC